MLKKLVNGLWNNKAFLFYGIKSIFESLDSIHESDVYIADMESYFRKFNKQGLFSDFMHYNAKGCRIFAEGMKGVIAHAMSH